MTIGEITDLLSKYPRRSQFFIYDRSAERYFAPTSLEIELEEGKTKDISLTIDTSDS